MKGGHNRTSDATKAAAGTYRADRARSEPNYRRARPKMPTSLSREARQQWRRLVPLMEEAGVLAAVDSDVLAAYCVLWARFQADPGTFTAALYGQMRLMQIELGITPKSRSHVRPIDEPPAKPDPRRAGVTSIDEVRARLERRMAEAKE